MAQRYEIRFSGSGGQGLITAGIILAEAVAIVEGRHAAQSQSYGPEARGGASKSEVIISDEPIDYPKATKVNVCLAMTQEAADKYAGDIVSGGILLTDADLVKNPPAGDFKHYQFPIIRTAKEQLGREIVANVLALGAIIALTEVVTRDSGEQAVLKRAPAAFKELNQKAYALGYETMKTLMSAT